MTKRTFDKEAYKYQEYLPTFPVGVHYDEPVEFKHVDHGLDADPEMPDLLGAASLVDDITPAVGTRLEGVDLAKLTDKQKDQLALLVAQRGVLVFPDQEISIEGLLSLTGYFGPLHLHAVTAMPPDPKLNAVHVVFSDGTKAPDPNWLKKPTWHSDQTYELNPPGVTALKLITAPPSGSDTIWSSGYAIFSSFSPQFQRYLETLTALHSSGDQIQEHMAMGFQARRRRTDTLHPLVRVHPVTGWKTIFVNPTYTKRIVGIPKVESDAVLGFIYKQVEVQQECQVRVRWKDNQVVVWDNRCLLHTALFDSFPHVRHGLRATSQAERPVSVEAYEKEEKKAKDWWTEKLRALGEEVDEDPKNLSKAGGAD
ncbi:TauD-domain-containing protein [Dacryopinax primogenitus]|uniref:TauD-domain-containing protein n=1 Tax=Dacryopinax primogenitus (strain DJM 731) TaxID=1858805 RepID=M5G9J3_DACPD|nr:TauD-domain-containing protein [Dacryopinax primogenitus]EJU04930.1 TauD-domain-containing protein [Dacryopinax primogenitus]